MISCGIDVGARAVKALLWDGQAVLAFAIEDTGSDFAESARKVLETSLGLARISLEDVGYIISTGYGRASPPFATDTLTEIACQARGIRHLFPQASTIIDIGGQDSKVIGLDGEGEVKDFAMNDRCAAGTGRFLEVIAGVLEMDLAEMGEVPAVPEHIAEIKSTCVVFAESEVISLLSEKRDKKEIFAGIQCAMANKILPLAGQVGIKEPIVFTGGVAKGWGMVKALSEALGTTLLVPEEPQITCALGAAILAQQASPI
jgi:predicted CoA-substrate-specific enzyme activase